MLKFVGGVLIFGAASMYGFLQAAHYVRRPKQIRGLINAPWAEWKRKLPMRSRRFQRHLLH